MTSALRALPLPDGARLIVIGDIHGCIEELEALLDRISPRPEDLVISAGDIVRKGPDPVACVESWRDRGYHAVLGNNEDDLLHRGWLQRWMSPRVDRAILSRRDLVSFIQSWPVAIDVAEASATVVHGGLFPGMRVTAANVEKHRDDLIRLRWIRQRDGSWERVPKRRQEAGDVLWPDVWDGDRTVLYGHTPLQKPRHDSRSIGLDTGCVYGGSLTAAIWDRGHWSTVSEKARRAWSD
jgi:predicted phosphodiesterase